MGNAFETNFIPNEIYIQETKRYADSMLKNRFDSNRVAIKAD